MTITIKVPATSANLGPGFDTLGLALDLWNESTFEAADDFMVYVEGEGVDIAGGTPAQFAGFIAEEAKRWAVVVKKANIRVE